MRGQVILLDEDDIPLIAERTWLATKPNPRNRTFYATASNTGGGRTYMHRLLTGFPDETVDHRNGNGLDNRRKNLRLASQGQNAKNLPMYSNNKSGFKGVYRAQDGVRWRAAITKDGKRAYLGLFQTAEEAAVAYNEAAKALHGEFARLNDV